jgi:hypothetical protein
VLIGDLLGKKNWLFAGSEWAGQRAAAIQSLLGLDTCSEVSHSV